MFYTPEPNRTYSQRLNPRARMRQSVASLVEHQGPGEDISDILSTSIPWHTQNVVYQGGLHRVHYRYLGKIFFKLHLDKSSTLFFAEQ